MLILYYFTAALVYCVVHQHLHVCVCVCTCVSTVHAHMCMHMSLYMYTCIYMYNYTSICNLFSTGSLFVQSLGSLTSLSDTGDSSVLLPNKYSASCDFWSVVHPHKRTRYQLTIQATSPEEEELLPLTRPTEYSLAMSPKDSDWPCVSAEVGEDNYIDDGCGPWSSLSLANHAVLTPSLTQVALELLKVLILCCPYSTLLYMIVYLHVHIHVHSMQLFKSTCLCTCTCTILYSTTVPSVCVCVCGLTGFMIL